MNFWQTKKLSEMSSEEWESLCDHCGQCCLNKLEDEDTGETFVTNVACDLLNLETCQCKNYTDRSSLVPDCLNLRDSNFVQFHWLPTTCAYRLLNEGKSLPEWHPLISRNPNSVKNAGFSASNFAIHQSEAGDLEDHILGPLF